MASLAYERGPRGEVLPESAEEAPGSKEEGEERWRRIMSLRFLSGDDADFDYAQVDDSDEYDGAEQARDAEDAYYEDEAPSYIVQDKVKTNTSDIEDSLTGQTGVQDF